jgi:hypothetical protein
VFATNLGFIREFGIAVHDHLIVGKDGHASLKALKLMSSSLYVGTVRALVGMRTDDRTAAESRTCSTVCDCNSTKYA